MVAIQDPDANRPPRTHTTYDSRGGGGAAGTGRQEKRKKEERGKVRKGRKRKPRGARASPDERLAQGGSHGVERDGLRSKGALEVARGGRRANVECLAGLRTRPLRKCRCGGGGRVWEDERGRKARFVRRGHERLQEVGRPLPARGRLGTAHSPLAAMP